MNSKQTRFVQEYLIDLNATQAAIRAGYSKKTAKQQGSVLLTNLDVAAAISTGQAACAERAKLDQDWVLEHLTANVERSMTEVPVFIAGEEVGSYTYQGSVANKALELLGKHLKMFDDRLTVGGDPNNPIVYNMHFEDGLKNG